MTRKLWAILICFMAVLALSGCQLAQQNADGTVAQDKLVGVFLTTEYLGLFDIEGYMNDHPMDFHDGTMVIDGDSQDYQGRLYATQTAKTLTHEDTKEPLEIKDYVFPVDGIPFFAIHTPETENSRSHFSSISDPAISDGHVHYQVDDYGDNITLTGTVYVALSNIARTYYYNPVYQSADGKVYAVSGSGFNFSTEAYSDGSSVYSQTIDETATVSENGTAQTDSTSITLSITTIAVPEKIFILQMDEESSVVSRAEYTPDAMPESIAVDPNVDYLIVEAHKRDSRNKIIVSRTIYGNGAEAIEAFHAREDGICVNQQIQLLWPESL